jgi:hypothetical protein
VLRDVLGRELYVVFFGNRFFLFRGDFRGHFFLDQEIFSILCKRRLKSAPGGGAV